MDTVLTLLLLGLVTLITVFFRRYSKNELSGLGCAFGSLIVTGLVFLLLIFMGIRGCQRQSEEEEEYWKDKTACDCVKAYENNEIEFNDLFYTWDAGLFPLVGFHPCEDIAFLQEDDWEAFNDSLTPTKSDTILTLRRLSNCD